MKQSSLTATSLRFGLVVAIVVVLGAIGAGFFFGIDTLKRHAEAVSAVTAEAATINTENPSSSAAMQQLVTQYQSAAMKADSLYGLGTDYQARIIKDINRYASESGVTITNYNFDGSATAVNKSVVVSLGTPLSYGALLKFVSAIENNLPKMQLAGLNISRAASGGGQVGVDSLNIEIYTR